ncbi:hypothetical protein MP638_002076 [Amoeboaphelidium occidentale]|nr:hypothetical protein MP638_002076 [Amoeboaphelidium occidentale]
MMLRLFGSKLHTGLKLPINTSKRFFGVGTKLFSAALRVSKDSVAFRNSIKKPDILESAAVKQETKPIVAYWLYGNCALVFSIVVVGGLTRLTESGLSMVDWSLLGSKPPLNQEEWEEYFEKYKQFPEYKLLNQGMTVDEFKMIYYYEYSHRMLGRVIGAFFLIPGAYFMLKKGYASSGIKKVIGGIGTLIMGQGLMGWYMVKSGLDHEIVENNDVPRVSQYRLAAHLTLAFTIFMLSLGAALRIKGPKIGSMTNLLQAEPSVQKQVLKFASSYHTVASLIFLTAISGAFVAGLDAGLIYNTFPLMGDRVIPEDVAAFSPWYKNMTENPSTVQFQHRMLATTTYAGIIAMTLWSRRLPLPSGVKSSSLLVAGLSTLQVALGISTLIYLVPIPLASLHQANSLALLGSAVVLLSQLKKCRVQLNPTKLAK